VKAALATAPLRVDLASGALTVSVAIDRRVLCRVERQPSGVAIDSKDTLQSVKGERVDELRGGGPVGLVVELLRLLGIDEGFGVTAHVRVPDSSGLGGPVALAVAAAAALGRAAGRSLTAGDLRRLAGEAAARVGEGPRGAGGAAAAIHGRCTAETIGGMVERLPVDPAAVEECLLLVDTGAGAAAVEAPAGEPPGSGPDDPAWASGVRDALLARRFDDLADVLNADWDVRAGRPGWLTAPRERVASALRDAGAGLRACGGGRGTVVAVVAAPGARGPGRRERVIEAARAAGLRLFPARVDLLGLDVEETA
jgi:hypothetical protein